MAQPGIVGVQPVPGQPGAYNAQLGNGQNMLVTGQAGKSLFDRFSQFAPTVASTALGAIPGAGAIKSIGDIAGGLKGNDDMGAPPGPTVAAPAVKGPTVPASAAPAPAAADPAAPPAPAPGQRPGPLGYSMKAVDPMTGREVEGPAVLREDGTVGVYVPPRAGSPGGLTKLGKGAIAASGEMESQIASARSEETAAREEGVMLAREQAQREQSFYEEQKIQNMLAAQDQQDENAAIAARVAERQDRYDRLSAEARAGRVDENQYMRGATGVFSALGMALGAAGAALARTPNFAADFVQSQIDRNIRRQEAELATKGKAADNALGDLLREQGSLKDAKATLKQLMTERTAIEANVLASTSKDQQIAARAREVAAQLAGQVAIQDKVRRQGDLEHVMTSRLYYQPGTAGSSGGFLQPTLQGMQNVKELQKPEGTPGESSKSLPTERTAMIADDSELIRLGNAILKNPALQGDSEFWGPEGSITRRLPAGEAIVNPETNQLYQDLQKWKNARIKAITGAGVSNQEAERIADAEVGNMSKNAIRHGVTEGVKTATVRTRGNLAPLSPAQQQEMLGTVSPEARRAILGEK